MLTVVVLVGLHDTDPGEARIVERPVVTAAPEPVQPVDHHDIQVGDVPVAHHFHVPGKIAGRRVHLTAGEAPHACLTLGLYGAGPLGEDACRRVVHDPRDTFDVADHVVVEHPRDPPPLVERERREVLPPNQALLLPRERGVHDRSGELADAQDARSFQDTGHAGRVVVGARRVGGVVKRIGNARVDVSRHDDIAARVVNATLNGDHVDDFDGVRDSVSPFYRRTLVEDLEAAAARRRDLVELGLDPPPRGPDSPSI